MDIERGVNRSSIRRLISVVAVLGAAGLFVNLLTGTLLRPMYFDERENLNYLWLISQGLHPHRDFWCTYPVAGYFFYLPLFKLLPEQAGDIIVLRAFSVLFVVASLTIVCVWSGWVSGRWWLPLFPMAFLVNAQGAMQDGLARVLAEFRPDSFAMLLAFASITLLLTDARGWKRILSMGLAVVSLAVMPKYVYLLAMCHGLDLLGRWVNKRLDARTILENACGGIFGLAVSAGMVAFMHGSLWDSWRWSFLLQARYQALLASGANAPKGFFSGLLVPFLQSELWVSISLLAGVMGFLVWAKRHGRRDQRTWLGGGLLLGVLVTIWRTVCPFNQYLPPVLLPLLFCFPFLGVVLLQGRRQVLAEIMLVFVMAVTVSANACGQARALARSTLFSDITQENALLAAVPANEQVMGAFAVIFRRPQTFVTYDEIWGEPVGFGSLVEHDPVVSREFSPERLREILQQSPPALIQITMSFPPGWKSVVQDYLNNNQEYYQRIEFSPSSDIRNDTFYIRRDLVK